MSSAVKKTVKSVVKGSSDVASSVVKGSTKVASGVVRKTSSLLVDLLSLIKRILMVRVRVAGYTLYPVLLLLFWSVVLLVLSLTIMKKQLSESREKVTMKVRSLF